MGRGFWGHSTVRVHRLTRLLGLVLPSLVLLAFLPEQTVTALAATTQAVAPLGVRYPAPAPQPKSASAHLPASGRPLPSEFAKPATPGSHCSTKPATPVPDRSARKRVPKVRATNTSSEAQPARQAAPAQQSCRTTRTSKADQGYKQARNKGKPVSPSPDWAPAASTQAPSPGARYGAATVYDGAGRQVLLFGGANTETSTVYSSTWIWNGKAWSNVTPSLSSAPSARVYAQAAYDPVHKQVVLFGGSPDGVGQLGDTWVWNGSTWSRLSPATAPPARSQGMMAWDPGLGKVVLYGGQAGGGATQLGDMWAWDGSTWSRLHPASSPGPLYGAAIAFDPAHHALLMFGGSPDGFGAVSSTWSFDGSSWKQLHPASTAPAREGAGMVYDTALGKVVLTGGAGMSSNTELNDTWTWDGSSWSRLSGISAPAARQDFGLTYDPAAGQVLMMGGSFGAGGTPGAATFADTNVLGLNAPTLTESVDKGANGLYPSGGTATYTLTVGNPGLLSGLAVTVQDQFPSSMALASAPIGILDVGTGASIGCDGQLVICTTSNNTLTITGLAVGTLDSLQIKVSLVVMGLGRACSDALDDAIASSLLGGSSPPISIPITICDTGLGTEPWWTFVNQSVGPQAEAKVNVSNGNLVVQQRDSTPVQAHGHLAYGLDRTYNSQDTTLLSFPGSFGAGWSLDIAQTGDLAGLGVGATGLYVPPLSSVLDPLAVTLIEPTGTRDVFQFKGLNATIDLTGLLGSGSTSPLADLVPAALSLDTSKFNHLCVDETFSAPPGVHLGLYRYIEVQSGNLLTPCSVPDPGTTPVLLGFATVSPERVRQEFSFDGHLVDIRDSSGTDLRYQYTVEPLAGIALGPLQAIYEPRSCSQPLASTCRAIRFHYGLGETEVTDPAGRVTKYFFDNTPLTPRLIKVVNPDGSQVQYAYQVNAFSGVDCGGSANQLCSITDNRGNNTRFTYTPPPLIGLDKVATMTDRRGTTTAFTYTTSPDSATADTAGHRSRFLSIDDSGRVGEIDEGDTSNNFLHQTLNTWDVAGATCQQPDAVVNNNLCRQVVKSLTSATPDEDMTYTYNPEGGLLHQHWASPALDQTSGFHAQYFEADGSVKTFDDTVQGAGAVKSDGPSTGRSDGGTLFAISDPTQSLSPRGNAAGTGFTPFLTTYKVDDNPAVKPNAVPASNPCADPNAPTSNTGDLCETDAPSFDGGAHATVTRNTYDTFGQKLTMTTPKAIAETPSGQPVPSYTYTYYQDADLDLSGNVSAGGWLKGITDPTGNFVAFAYDRAGDVVRTWDRNATRGHTLADFPGTISTPPSGAFTETLYGTGSTAYSAPWRYVLSQRDQLGDLTTFKVDQNGNQVTITPPRGNQAGNSGFDVTQTFDHNDNLLTTLMPLEASANNPTSYTYDAFDNRTSTTDPDGNVTTAQFDTVNRQVGAAFTRGPFPSDTSQVPPACRQSAASDAPIPAGRILCSTAVSYDGVDNKVSTTDGNHQVTTYAYDGVRRLISRLVPRNADGITTVRTDTVYDADGNVTDVCPPNEFTTKGSNACTSTAAFSTHRTYDVAGRVASSTTFRAAGQPDTSSFAYDADGNLVSTTDPNSHTTTTAFNMLDRKAGVTVPRDATTTNTTTFNYDPVGNTTAIVQPGNRITASSYDAANRLTDTVQGSDSLIAGQAGLPDAGGGSNIRTRVAYDVDGHAVAQFAPSAFATSTSNPNPAFMTRTDIDQDGRTTAVFQPRYDAGSHSDLGLSTTQSAQCTTNPSPQQVPGVPGFPAGVGVCVTHYQYDAAGRHTRTVLATSSGSDNRFVDYSYTDDGLTAAVNAPSPAQNGARVTAASYLYDGNGKQVKQTDALGHQQTTSYTSDELVAQQAAQPNGSITHVTKQSYDANGNPTATTDPLGNVATVSYYTDNLNHDSIDGAGNDTRYVYDPAGNLVQKFSPSAVAKDATNPEGIPVSDTYTFDNLLLTTSQAVTPGTTPDLQRTTYGYDAGGRKTSQTVDDLDSQGNLKVHGGTQSFSYFNNDRLNQETGRHGETIAHAYDPNGNETSAKDSTSGGSTVASTFYLDNQARTVDDGSRTSQYTYDGQGQKAAMATLVDGSSSRSTTTYSYGEAEQTLSMSSSIVGGGTTSFSYDAVGRLASQQDPNGQKTAFSFNPDDTLASKTLSNPSGSSVAAFNYLYDGNFQITSQTFTGQGNKQGKQAYTYDKAGRLAGFTDGSNPTQQVTFDHDGNRLSVGTNNGSSTYNPDDTLASITDNTGALHPQIYSFRGDLINDGCFTYTYDGFDRMTTVTPTGAAGCPSTPGTSYTYDGLNRQRTTGSTTLHYDGTSSLVSVESSAGIDTAYEITPDGQTRAVAVQAPAAGSPQYLSDDGQGNITTVTSSTGALSCSVRYDPWGSPLAAQSPSNPCDAGSTINDHFYRNQRLDPVTGNYQLGNRAYSPSKASFINPDTYRIAPPSTDLAVQADPLTQNRYAYVNGDPINLYDPTGHCGSWWNPSNWGCHAAQAYHSAKQWVQQQVNSGIQTVKQVWHDAQQTVGNAIKTVTNTVRSVSKTVVQGVRQAWHATAQFVVQHKAEIAGIAAGIAVGVGCEIATAGAGTLGCAALAGAVGSAVQYSISASENNSFSWGGLAVATGIGALTGLAGGAAGEFVVGAVGARLVEGSGIGEALAAGASRVVGQARSEIGGLARNAAGIFSRLESRAATGAVSRLVSTGERTAIRTISGGAPSEEGVTLFRGVGAAEAADIRATGTYRIAGASAEFGKYFYPTLEQAQALVEKGWASQVTSAIFPRSVVEAAEQINPAGEGPAYFVPSEFFPHGPVNFH